MSTTAVSSGAEGTAVILGASGAVGKPLLSLLVSDKSPYSTVYSFARRPHPSPPIVASNIEYKEILVDFEKLHTGDATETAKFSSIPAANAIFITMGTTRAAAGSMSAFERIDRGYVLSAAQALLNPTKQSTLVYCSSGSSSSTSWFPYLKSKGLTEEALANLYQQCIIVRPAFLQNANRPQTRLLERLFEPVVSLASNFTDSAAVPVSTVAHAIVEAAKLGPKQLKQMRLAQNPPNAFKLEHAKSSNETVIVQNPAVLKLGKGQI
ncbi:uncharacterized protein UTRI_01370_B [Ustilago trichophora]|uniref:Uncharacterized protein n=1 Tax=Ustilago trichophora TaxID=86804 RepID=A0A5C3E420_9BASI|nr:uncharacterized protein UTRI_01370_B [Ustilago trichophora]